MSEYPELAELIPTERYEDETWGAMRRKVDDLDQVTFDRKRI